MVKKYYIRNSRCEDVEVSRQQFYDRINDIIRRGIKIHWYSMNDYIRYIYFHQGEHYIYTITDFREVLSKVR